MALVQEVLDYARFEVNDTASARYLDTEGLKHANAAIARALELRPDLRMGTSTSSGMATGYGWGAFTALTATSSFPLPYEYIEKIGKFVVAGWQGHDDQFTNDQTRLQGEQSFVRGLLGS